MLVIGLTGGIGSGKSTVTDLFARLGVPIIDADVIAKQLTSPKQEAFENIIKHFGSDILDQNGQLNRKRLGQIIFQNNQERQWLEKLLHPEIERQMHEQIKQLSTSFPYCIAAIPLLIEVHPYSFIDRILVIDIPEPLQIERVMARDHLSKKEVSHILSSQTSRENRLAKAHDVIINTGSLADLTEQVKSLHQQYLKMKHT